MLPWTDTAISRVSQVFSVGGSWCEETIAKCIRVDNDGSGCSTKGHRDGGGFLFGEIRKDFSGKVTVMELRYERCNELTM